MRLSYALAILTALAGLTATCGCSADRREQEIRASAERFMAAWKAGDQQALKGLICATLPDARNAAGTRGLTAAEAEKVAGLLVANQKLLADNVKGLGGVAADSSLGVVEVCVRRTDVGARDEFLGYTNERTLLVLRPCLDGWRVDIWESRTLWAPYSSGQVTTPGLRTTEWIEPIEAKK